MLFSVCDLYAKVYWDWQVVVKQKADLKTNTDNAIYTLKKKRRELESEIRSLTHAATGY